MNNTKRFLIVAATAGLAGVLQAQQATSADFHWDKALPAGNEVSVHNVTGRVTVKASTSGKVEVTGTKRGDSRDFDRVKAEVHETSRGVYICAVYQDTDSSCDEDGVHTHGRWRDNDYDRVRMDFDVAVPANLLVSAGSVSGDVDVSGIPNEVDASSVSGDVGVSGAKGRVSAHSVSGRVRLDHIQAESLDANSVSGDVEATVDALQGNGDLRFHTVSGDVTLDLPKTLDADLSMSTVSGDFDSDFPVTLNGRMQRRRIEARIGKGGRRLDIQTVSGDVRLRSAK